MEDVNWVRNKKLELQLFLDELSPATVAVDDIINHHIYNGVANAQKVDDAIKKIESQLSYLERYYYDSISMTANFPETKPEIYKINEARSAVDQIGTIPFQRKPEMELTEKQSLDYKKFEYQCQDKVDIPGKIRMKRNNRIVVNGNDIDIGDSLFHRFLRLVVELKKGKGGWVIIDKNYQAYGNLRNALKGSLLEKGRQRFIENDGSKNYRISTHPDFVTYDKEKLLNHQDLQVRKLTEELP